MFKSKRIGYRTKVLWYDRVSFLDTLLKLKSMKRPGTEAIRTQIQRSKPKRKITKITNSQNTTRIYGQPSEQLFPKRWPLSNPKGTVSRIIWMTQKTK